MSIEIKNAVVIDKKGKNQDVTIDFFADNSSYTTIISDNINDQKSIIDILNLKKKISSGKYSINGNDRLDRRTVKRNVAFIRNKKYSFKNLQFSEMFQKSLFYNRKFRVESSITYIKNKYEYMSYKDTKGNLTDIQLREKIDTLIKNFIDSTIEIEEKWLNEFKVKMAGFFKSKIDEIKGDIPEFLLSLFNEYSSFSVSTWSNYLFETFLESLWDKLYHFNEVEYSCNCEHNFTKNKFKNNEILNLKKQLNFSQHRYIIKKYLKSVETRIVDCKSQDSNNRRVLKKIEIELFLTSKKATDFSSKDVLEKIKFWKKISTDQYNEFKDQQEHVFFTNLLDESMQIRGKIIELVHSFHQKLLSNSVEYLPSSNFNDTLKELELKVEEPKKQAAKIPEILINTFNIEDVEKLSYKLKRIIFNFVWSYYLKKNNIITLNIFSSLQNDEVSYLLKFLNKILISNKNFTFIFIEKNIFNNPILKSKCYIYRDNFFLENNFENQITNSPEIFSDEIFFKYNKIQFKQDKKNVLLFEKNKVKIEKELTGLETHILINPFKIKVNKKDVNTLFVEHKVKIIKNNLFKDPKMHLTYSENGRKIFVYNTDDKFKNIFIDDDSVIKFI